MVIVKDQSFHLVYLNISQKITHLSKFELDWSWELRDNYEKTTLVTRSVKLLLLENYVTSEGAVYHNVLYYQPLPITSSYMHDYCEPFVLLLFCLRVID